MSERQQGTVAMMRERMIHKYGDGLHHKHNKNHFSYRKHFKSHPVQQLELIDETKMHEPTGDMRELKLRKFRKRLDKGCYH